MTARAKRTAQGPQLVIGLTGGIAAGKSTVAAVLASDGFPIIDTDALARSAVAPGTAAWREIISAFGRQCLCEDGSLDRGRLREIVLKDPRARRRLETLIHPEVRKEVERLLHDLSLAGHPAVVVEVPLLFEAGWEDLFDVVVAVTAPEEVCIERLARRHGVSEAMARDWIATQMPQGEKARRSRWVIINDRDIGALRRRTKALGRVLRREAQSAGAAHGEREGSPDKDQSQAGPF